VNIKLTLFLTLRLRHKIFNICFWRLCLDLSLFLNFQWITVIRKHAEVIVDDDVIFSIFKKYCKVCNRSQFCLTTILLSF